MPSFRRQSVGCEARGEKRSEAALLLIKLPRRRDRAAPAIGVRKREPAKEPPLPARRLLHTSAVFPRSFIYFLIIEPRARSPPLPDVSGKRGAAAVEFLYISEDSEEPRVVIFTSVTLINTIIARDACNRISYAGGGTEEPYASLSRILATLGSV